MRTPIRSAVVSNVAFSLAAVLLGVLAVAAMPPVPIVLGLAAASSAACSSSARRASPPAASSWRTR